MVFLVVMFILVAIGILIVYHTIALMRTGLFDTGEFTATELQPADDALTAITDWNAIFAFIYVGVNLATAISAFMVRSHPIMFLVFFIIQVIAVFLSGQMITVWQTISTDAAFSTDILLFGWIDSIFANYGVMTLIFSLIVALAMMAIPL